MKRTLFLKVFGTFALIVLLTGAFVVGLSISTVRRHDEEASARHLETLGRALQPDVETLLDRGASAELNTFAKEAGRRIRARVTVVDPQGVVLADSEKDPASMESHRYRPEIAAALEGRIGRSLRFSYTVESRMMYVGIPLEKDGSVRAVLRLSYYMRTVDELIAAMRKTILRAAIVVILLALLAALFFSFHLVRPVRRLTLAAGRVASGDLRSRVLIRNRDEFKALGDGFNAMMERIDSLVGDLNAQKENLLAIIGAVNDGLVLVGRDGRILLANDPFTTLAGDADAVGKFFWEAVRRPRLQELVDRVRSEKSALREEFRWDDRRFLCRLNYLPAQDGVVLAFHDLTELRKVEDIKKDFVVNASHELRTPVAAIQGAVELLEEESQSGGPSAAVDILKRNAGRLGGIVDDLLKLGELEDRGFRLDIGPVDVRDLAADVLKTFETKARAKGLEMRLEADPGLPLLPADASQIERLLQNLVDNALKYTERGSVAIRIRAEGSCALIEVADTGPGIPVEHLGRIFERFYVVDRARSRRMGATGLGLAIVKHIAHLHGGAVEVRSEEGRGTTFTVRLPLGSAAPAKLL